MDKKITEIPVTTTPKSDMMIYISQTENGVVSFRRIPVGEAGIQGPPGPAGKDGVQGPKGDPFTYSDFTPEQLEALRGPQGQKGEPGETGSAGQDGAPGEPGPAGRGITGVRYESSARLWTISYSDGSSEQVTGPAIPTQLSDLAEDTSHRTVTDTEKSSWNGKADKTYVDGLVGNINTMLDTINGEVV